MQPKKQPLTVTDVLDRFGVTDADIAARVKVSKKRPKPKTKYHPQRLDHDGAAMELAKERLTAVIHRGAWCSVGQHPMGERDAAVAIHRMRTAERYAAEVVHYVDNEIACRPCYGDDRARDDDDSDWYWERYAAPTTIPCPGCGRSLTWFGKLNGNRRHAYCSDRCRGRVIGGHPQVATSTCAECEGEYRAARTDSRYCSSACRQKAHRDRHRASR